MSLAPPQTTTPVSSGRSEPRARRTKKNDGQDDRQFPEVPSHHSERRQVDAFNAYTAGCGHAFATSSGFPESWRNRRAFVCGPTGHLLGMYDARPKGSGFESVNAFSLVASADEWFSPIVAEVGPDGNLWFADWYNFIIQHNPTPNPNRGGYAAKTGPGNAHANPNRDRQHGRIYRLVYEGNDAQGFALRNADWKKWSMP